MIKVFNRTKVIATVGPASGSYDVLSKLVAAGVDVFRLNFSHATREKHLEVIGHVEKINRLFHTNVGILIDLQGPKLRIGEVEGGKIKIKSKDKIVITTEPCVGNKERLYVNYKGLAKDLRKGENVLVDDGKIEMQVLKTNGKEGSIRVLC